MIFIYIKLLTKFEKYQLLPLFLFNCPDREKTHILRSTFNFARLYKSIIDFSILTFTPSVPYYKSLFKNSQGLRKCVRSNKFIKSFINFLIFSPFLFICHLLTYVYELRKNINVFVFIKNTIKLTYISFIFLINFDFTIFYQH